MSLNLARHFCDRADSFMRLMKLGADQEIIAQWLGRPLVEYEDGTALLAVHAGIALADAVLVSLTGKRSTAENHEETIPTLKKMCGKHKRNADGISHYEWLVQKKSYFAYGDRRVRSEDVVTARVHVERMATWVYQTFPHLVERDNDANAAT